MKQVIAIYSTDPWHSRKSRELVAVATTPARRDVLIRRYLKKWQEVKIPNEDIEKAMQQIDEWGQTQFLAEKYDFEIDTETYETNEIIY